MPNPYDKYGPSSSIEDLFPSQPRQPRQRASGPLRVRQPEPEEPVVPEEEEELGWFRTYAPHVARGIGGLLGVTPLTGAAGGAGGEIVAQAIEQGDWTPELDPKRIAAETAIGAAGGGFAKMLGAGITSVGRALGAGAALGGSAPIIRHGIEEGEWDPREYAEEVGTGAALGGAVGGGLAKLLGSVKGRPAGPASRYEIESTSVPGGQVLGTKGQGTQYVNPVRPIVGSGESIGVKPPTVAPVADDLSGVPYVGMDAAPLPSQTRLINNEAKAAERAAKAAEKQSLEEKKLTEIKKLMEGRGRVEPKLRESVSTTDPATGHRLGANFKEIVEEGGEDAGGVLARQAEEPVAPVEDIHAEMGRIRQELARMAPEAPVAPVAEALAPSPLEEMLTPQQGGKTRVSKPRKSKSERFDERAAKIAGQFEAPRMAQAVETEAERAARVRSTPVDMAKLDEEIAASAPQAPQSLQELLSQVPASSKTRVYTPEGMVEGPFGSDPTDMMAALRGEVPAPALPDVPDLPALPAAPLATPEAPQDLMQILRTRVGATGKNYRLAKKAAEAGEIPSADYARQVHKAEQAAFTPQKPVAPAPTSWMDDEAAEITRLSALPREQRLAAFLGEETPIPPVTTTPDVPVATPEAEPEWVAQAMKEADEIAAMQSAQPTTPPPVSDLDKVLSGAPTVPPTAEQFAELQRLRQESGAISDPSDVPSWMRNMIALAPEAPPSVKPTEPTVLAKLGQEGKPRLNKDKKWGPGHEGPPNPQDYRPKSDKERGAVPTALMAQLGMGLAGATVGGATDPLDDPLLSAMAGGAVGLSVPTIAQGLMKLGAAPSVVQDAMQDLNLPDGTKRAAAKIARVLPQMQRANYLADVIGLGANAWFGPYGSGVFGALEKGLAGDTRGWAALNELKNPWSFFKEYPSAFHEARALVGRAEGFSEAEAIGALEKKLTLPGTLLTGGDVAIRRILERHGFSADEARIMTMTGEPFTKSGESLTHLRGLIPDLTFPFKRTPVNIVEQGLLRTPGVGFLQQGIGAARGTRAADPMAMQLAQQAMGAGVGVGSEQLGEYLDPEQARVLRRFITNFAGPYSLLAGAGLAAGQARRRGQPVVGTTVRNIAQQLPLPSIEPIQEAAGLGAKLIDRGPSAIRGEDIPRGAYPAGLIRNYQAVEDFFNPPQLPPRRRRRS